MTVWDVFWFLFVFIPLTILWIITLVDIIRRADVVGWQKALWVMVIIFFPWIGVFAYLIARPREAPMPEFMTAPPRSAQPYAAQGTSTVPPTQYPSDTHGATA
jgi:hypothetical protein